jgi:hypothetical protein
VPHGIAATVQYAAKASSILRLDPPRLVIMITLLSVFELLSARATIFILPPAVVTTSRELQRVHFEPTSRRWSEHQTEAIVIVVKSSKEL